MHSAAIGSFYFGREPTIRDWQRYSVLFKEALK
jgi:hypothetical protein